MCPKIMNFVENFKIQLNKVVENFKLNPSNKKIRLAYKWKIPTIES